MSLLCNSQGESRSSDTAIDPSNVESVGSSIHIETAGSVALQTAQAQVAGKGNAQIRVLFDSTSHMSFVTLRVAKEFSLETHRKQWLSVNTFGQRAMGFNLREVVGLHLTPVGGGNMFSIEAFVVPEISTLPN